jgi:hypothetical protein
MQYRMPMINNQVFKNNRRQPLRLAVLRSKSDGQHGMLLTNYQLTF